MLPGSKLSPREPIFKLSAIPFYVAHLVPLLAFVTGVSTRAIILCVVLYLARVFCITAGYHRYFAHRAYRMGRIPQFLVALGGATAVQKGPLWWASHHRAHHRYTDTDRDPHSPGRGFFWSHMGWIVSDRFKQTDLEGIEDFAKYPELRWINKYEWVAAWGTGVFCYLIAGWSGLVVGFFLSTVLLWHATFSINSIAHIVGWRRFATSDSSRNNPVLAMLTLGEGWHNNHHHYPRAARQGIRWWEVDVTYYVLRALQTVRIVRDVHEPPARTLGARQTRAGADDVGLIRYHLSRAAAVAGRAPNADQIAQVIESAAKQVQTIARNATPSSPKVAPQRSASSASTSA
jgi:stearoyl-CoA desaturase (delta-9 desaturase)